MKFLNLIYPSILLALQITHTLSAPLSTPTGQDLVERQESGGENLTATGSPGPEATAAGTTSTGTTGTGTTGTGTTGTGNPGAGATAALTTGTGTGYIAGNGGIE